MKNRKKTQSGAGENRANTIPNITVIDLEHPSSQEDAQQDENGEDTAVSSRINMHIVFLIVFLLLIIALIVGVAYRFLHWGRNVDLDEFFKDGTGTVDNTLDMILPLKDENENPLYRTYGKDSTIVFFGNGPFADDRSSKDNLVNLIQEMTGATVYNCSVEGSYLAALNYYLEPKEYPMDIFNFYWLCHVAAGDEVDPIFLEGVKTLGASAPAETMDVYNTLNALDPNTVDVIAIMYDASDYLAGHSMFSLENSTDISTFTGNLEAGIGVLKDAFPNARIMVLSPAYAYGIDENGKYVSSDIQRYGHDVLSTYVSLQSQSCYARGVTFVDNLYGTITEDNASEYLTDNLHLNLDGRKKIAQRFVDALNYFSKLAK